jgi:hypothetical protein
MCFDFIPSLCSPLGRSCVAHTISRDSPPEQPRYRFAALTLVVPNIHRMSQKFCEGVAEVLSMPYYTLTAHQLSPSVVSALLNMLCIPASAVALYLLRSFLRYSQVNATRL